MNLNEIVDGIHMIINQLRQDQSPSGSWDYPFETGIATDCYTIILLRSLEIDEEILIKQLTERIISKQERNGAWKLYYDEPEGNLSATLEAYYALLYSGNYPSNDVRLQKAKDFILSKGGIEKSHTFTKFMLALTGQLQWPAFFPIPLEMILLPVSFPIHFYDFSVYGRANLTPIMILADNKYQLKTGNSPDLSDLLIRKNISYFQHEHSNEWRILFSLFEKGVNSLMDVPKQIHHFAVERAKQYMLSRIEPDGTFYNYYSSTFLMIFALLSLGYSKKDPIIVKAVEGILLMKCEINDLPHMQYTTASVWNTALINTALQEAGIFPRDPMVTRANHYLLQRQHVRYGDWVIHNPKGVPGGWGFSDMNTLNPDVDDTTATLRSIARLASTNNAFRQAWDKGVHWVLSMQNDDGGWPAFEKNTDNKMLQLLPIEGSQFLMADPSSADITGRTIEFFSLYTNLATNHHSIRSGIKWLLNNQESNGSWYGRWGICYIYGTWAAITGLGAISEKEVNPSIMKAVNWLQNIQNKDGGWGESCLSDIYKKYVPLESSTLTHTAWALDSLITVSDKPTSSIEKGIQFLLNNLDREDWSTSYPKGQGMAGAFYIHYHSYRYIFPLLTLSHFRKKYLMN